MPKSDRSEERTTAIPSRTAILLDPDSSLVPLDLVADAPQRPVFPVRRFRASRRAVAGVLSVAFAGLLVESDRKDLERLAKAIGKAAKGGISQAVLVVKPGQRRLRFFYTIVATREDEGAYGFDVLGPLATFALQPGGSLSAVALLARGTTLVEAHGCTDPANLSGELPLEQAIIAQRQILGWYHVNDPLFRIGYRY